MRKLLLTVSHWYVNSDATVALIKGAFGELNAAPKIGRAEALRRSMLALIDKGPERFAQRRSSLSAKSGGR